MDLVISKNAIPQELNSEKISDYLVIRSLSELRDLIDGNPHEFGNVILDDTTVSFDIQTMESLRKLVKSGYLFMNQLTYVTTREKDKVEKTFNALFSDIKFTIIPVKQVNLGVMTNVINGEVVLANKQKASVIHKVKLNEYIEQNGKNKVTTSKPIVDPNSIKGDFKEISVDQKNQVFNIVNFGNYTTTVFMSILYDRIKTNSSVFTMEFDKYNYFSDYMVRFGVSDYITDVDKIKDNKHCLLLNSDYLGIDYNTLFDYIFNTTNFDSYLRVVSPDDVVNITKNMYFPLVPTVDNVVRLLQLIDNCKPPIIHVALFYKGFRDVNELTQRDVYDTICSITDAEVDLTSFIIKEMSLLDLKGGTA